MSTPLQHAQTWRFEALDTWFFKESRPLDAVGGAQLNSTFPPPARTLIGAVRTTLGDALGGQWQHYGQPGRDTLSPLIGTPNDLGPLSFEGPYILHRGQRLYPAPLVLMCAEQAHVDGNTTTRFTRLQPGTQTEQTDLGWVRLPKKQDASLQGAKPAEDLWLTRAGLQAVLQGKAPQEADLVKAKHLFATEERLGIARDHHSRRPIDGLLYQTRHVRPGLETALGLTVRGLDHSAFAALPTQGLARLGAEGRLAAWSRTEPQPLPTVPTSGRQLMLCLLSHAEFEHGWVPDGFVAQTTDTDQRPCTHWHGMLAGRNARLVSAVTGKPVREGGWDMAAHQPRAVQGLVPAGSCYFFEFDSAEDARHVAQTMHGTQWGQHTAWGRGLVAVGTWN